MSLTGEQVKPCSSKNIVSQVKLSYQTEKEVLPTQSFTSFAVLQLVVQSNNEKERPNLGIVGVLDKSDSMREGKLSLVKTSMQFVREQLQKEDMLGVVSYNHQVEQNFPMMFAQAELRPIMEKSVNEIRSSGTTNLSGGLIAGIKQQTDVTEQQIIQDDTVQALLLCTDGLANVGIVNTKELTFVVKSLLLRVPNLRIHTFGFGQDHDPNMLQQIAEAGKGKYFFVENDESIPEAFGDALGGLLSVGAQNVKVTIIPLFPSFQVVRIWDKVIDHEINHNGIVIVTFNDLLVEVERKLLFEYYVDKADVIGQQNLAFIKVECFNVVMKQIEMIECTLSINRQQSIPNDQNVNQEVLKNVARVLTFEQIGLAKQQAEGGNFKRAQETMKRAITDLTNTKIEDQDFRKYLYQDLNELLQGFQNRENYELQGKFNSSAILNAFETQTNRFVPRKRGRNQVSGLFQQTSKQRRFRDASQDFLQRFI